MTTIADQNLEWIQTLYQSSLNRVLHSGVKENILLSQYGDFNQSKIDSTLKLVEAAVLESGDKRQTMKRFNALLVEVLQNISLHSASDKTGHQHAFIVISRSSVEYRLISGNLVLVEDIPGLEQRFEQLNGMDKNSLRKLYIETLCNDEFSFKGGAGLGLLTLAKRADQKLRYEFHTLDGTYGYFQMEVNMGIE